MKSMTESLTSPSATPASDRSGDLDSLLSTLVGAALDRRAPTREQALALLATGDDALLDVVAAAGRVRRAFFGRRVKLNYLVNMKSCLCP